MDMGKKRQLKKKMEPYLFLAPLLVILLVSSITT